MDRETAKKVVEIKNQTVDQRVNEYYGRIVRLKPLIMADRDMLKRFKSAIDYMYEDKKLGKEVMCLGSGSEHQMYNIGSVVDPENQRKVYIAARLRREEPLFFFPRAEECLRILKEQLSEYEAAYAIGEITPYFMGVITFPGMDGLQSCSIITEDISNGKTLRLEEEDSSRVKRTNADGSTELIFVDPLAFTQLKIGGKSWHSRVDDYVSDKARIDLPKNL